ncbi:MAG: noncanonical pyrimidine nucleotidase, YjjG family, partial [Chloroflexi bacterium]|nr:noncanonical pyrimidine nucleotidase, YjjG family [Chloroflexota bacterium]
MSYQWLLFDADGTLFDYYQAEDAALAQNFLLHGLDFQANDRLRYREINHQFWLRFEQGQVTSGALRVGRFRQLFAELNIDLDVNLFSQTYLEQLAQQAPLLEGAAELIEALNGRYRLALITNGLADVQYPRLERSGLQTYFTAVIVSDEVGVAKPNPLIFDEAFSRMGNPAKEEVLIIGDSLSSDMTGGINYGIDTC